jgi:GNAT superfamily N-acetyltransferase
VLAVRKAVPGDAAAIAAIAAAAYAPYEARIGRPPAPVTADYGAAVARGEVWVAQRDDDLVGLLVLVDRPDHVLLENVAVIPSAQGSGIGARLLAHAEALAAALGRPEVRLYTNVAMTENLAYYPRHGYVETHRGVQDGFHRVYFSKPLEPGL